MEEYRGRTDNNGGQWLVGRNRKQPLFILIPEIDRVRKEGDASSSLDRDIDLAMFRQPRQLFSGSVVLDLAQELNRMQFVA